jgi:putative membrane protein
VVEPSDSSGNRRTQLAADRTVFAAERTFAAWMRTGLASLAAGVGARKLLQGLVTEWVLWSAAVVLILFSAFCFVAAVWRDLRTGLPPPQPDVARISPVILIVVSAVFWFLFPSAPWSVCGRAERE